MFFYPRDQCRWFLSNSRLFTDFYMNEIQIILPRGNKKTRRRIYRRAKRVWVRVGGGGVALIPFSFLSHSPSPSFIFSFPLLSTLTIFFPHFSVSAVHTTQYTVHIQCTALFGLNKLAETLKMQTKRCGIQISKSMLTTRRLECAIMKIVKETVVESRCGPLSQLWAPTP